MSKKQSNPMPPKGSKRPTPPPTPPEGRTLREGQEPIAPQINPHDYLRIVTEGDVAPDKSFIWTHDRNEESFEKSFKLVPSQQVYTTSTGTYTPEHKKVYCIDCKYYSSFLYYNCFKVSGYIETPEERKKVYAKPKSDNKENNCKYYLEKWYIKLWGMFK